MDAAAPFVAGPARPAMQTLSAWLVDAWRLFRRAPVRMVLLSLLPLMAEGALQLLPGIGIVLSKLLTPLASAWVLVMLDSKARGTAFAPAAASGVLGSRLVPLFGMSLLFATVFGFQLLVAAALGGIGQAAAMALGDIAGLQFGRVELAVILTSGLLPGALLMFVMPRVLLDGVGVGRALGESAHQAVLYWRPVALVTLAVAGLIAGMLWLPPLLLILPPFATLVGYTSYRDVFARIRRD